MTSNNPLNLPPEWAGQSAVLLAWPKGDGGFSPWLPEVEDSYEAIATAIARRERLIIACWDETLRQRVAKRLKPYLASISLVIAPYDLEWVRDTAPITVETGQRAKLLNFRFNGWGNKYEHGNDAALAKNLHNTGIFGKTHMESVDFVLEGGSLETDGEGTLLTTTRCLLNPNRNPSLNQAQIEGQLINFFGLKRVLWLNHGQAEGDDTDAHVDTLARFCSPDMIAYTASDDPKDPMHTELKAMENELKALKTVDGNPYRLVPLPVPKPILSEEGDRLPATYVNFLIINGAVLVPLYDDPEDANAFCRLSECFPDRDIIGIPATPLIRQYGSIHCMTLQFPKSVTVAET
ncbi:MAG: agmatine deiminase family protein [Candidatus Methylumidiphilus sp.]